MRKNQMLFSMLAMAGMLFVTSCSQDEAINDPSSGNFVDAKFTISTADGMTTRATVGNGTKADKVVCAVFDEKGEEMNLLRQTVDVNENKEALYQIRLAKGQQYRVAFFAYNEAAAAYDVTNMKNIVVKAGQNSNVEERDAFTAYVDVKPTVNAITENVTLKRPFAQLNLGVDAAEWKAAVNAGVTVDQSKIVVSNVYNAFSAYDNAVVTTATEGEMTFDLNKIPTERLEVDVNKDGTIADDEKFYYLALNYLLVGDADTEKSLTDVEFVWKTEDGKTNYPTTQFINIPVQRNYRTNILGKLLTNPAEFNIVIDEKFVDDKIVNEGDEEGNVTTVTTTVATVEELQAALNAATSGNHIIKFEQDINASSTRAASYPTVTVVQKQGVSIVLDGCAYKYDGVIKVHASSSRNTGYLAIKNINFETSTASLTFIQALEEGSNRYSQDVTIENCTFTAVDNSEAVKTAVGISVEATQNLKVKNCTATNMHSLLQAQSCDKNIDVDNITVVNGKNGVSFGNTAAPTLTNSRIEASGYGVRADGDASRGNLVIKNTTVNANIPVAVRRMTSTYSVALEGNNTLTAGQLYQVVFTNHNKEEAILEAPTGTYTITGAEEFNVYPVKEGEALNASSNEQLSQAIAAGASTINLGEGEYTLPSAAAGQTVTISGTEDTKISVTSGLSYANGATVTFEGVTIQSEPEGAGYTNGFADFKYATFNQCVIEGTIGLDFSCEFNGCTFNITGDYYNVWTWGAGTVKFNGCTFNSDGKALLVYANVLDNGTDKQTVQVDDCTFNDKGGLTDLKAAIEIGDDYNKSYELIVNNTTVNGYEINDKGINTGTTLWANKNSLTQERLNVVVDGVDVY